MIEEIKSLIQKAIKEISKEEIGFSIEVPNEKSHGDYSTNVALILAKKLKKNPVEVANEIKNKIDQQKFLEKIEVAGPGFINFFLAKEVFIDNLKQVLKTKKPAFAKASAWRGKKTIVEFTDPNPFKEFHIGHLTTNSIGEALSRILDFQGAKVKRACYQGDVGMHVAKAIWGKIKNKNLEWAQAYAFGNKNYEENEQAKKEIIELNKKIYQRTDKNINKLYDQGKKESLKYFDKIYKKLDTNFDYFFFESQVSDFGKKIVKENLDKVFEKGLPAQAGENPPIIFKGEKFGLHTRVFINSEGLPTYEAKELGLAKIKYKKYSYDESVIVTGNEINSYFKVLLCAMSQIFPDLAEKTKHVGHGMMRLPEGKMSSRTGKVVTAESFLQKIEELVLEKIKDRKLTEKERKEISQKVAVGAVKYSILKQSIGSDIIYDFDKSISFKGDSGPYLQYSLTRAKSVLRKAKAEKIKYNPNLQINPHRRHAAGGYAPNNLSELEKKLFYFPEVVEKAGKEFEPHFIVLYLTELASAFNAYYAENQIVNKEDKLSPYKVALTKAFEIIMENGLNILAIPVLDRM